MCSVQLLLQDIVTSMSLKRLQYENESEVAALTDATSPYFGKKAQYALRTYAYYMCFKCKVRGVC